MKVAISAGERLYRHCKVYKNNMFLYLRKSKGKKNNDIFLPKPEVNRHCWALCRSPTMELCICFCVAGSLYKLHAAARLFLVVVILRHGRECLISAVLMHTQDKSKYKQVRRAKLRLDVEAEWDVCGASGKYSTFDKLFPMFFCWYSQIQNKVELKPQNTALEPDTYMYIWLKDMDSISNSK